MEENATIGAGAETERRIAFLTTEIKRLDAIIAMLEGSDAPDRKARSAC